MSGLLSRETSPLSGIAPEMPADRHRRSVSRWHPRRRRRGARSNVPATRLVPLGTALRRYGRASSPKTISDIGIELERRPRCPRIGSPKHVIKTESRARGTRQMDHPSKHVPLDSRPDQPPRDVSEPAASHVVFEQHGPADARDLEEETELEIDEAVVGVDELIWGIGERLRGAEGLQRFVVQEFKARR